ncbi:hypothetical protein [Thermobispora bispora]|uniref:hypothetical protein n=1 Tax=Thermobispora bispora TaxID=2006 RepID=UPI00197EC6AE|nr:hypothetical protein [Thermobispora bispora]QSI46868.1 hypothetical protein CYL17_02610 [Thermobispora bispora]
MITQLAAAGVTAALLAAGASTPSPTPTPTRTVVVGKDGVPEEIVVVPIPIDSSGRAEAVSIPMPDFGPTSIQLAADPRSRRRTSGNPAFDDRFWDRHWQVRQPAKHKRPKKAQAVRNTASSARKHGAPAAQKPKKAKQARKNARARS